jgi:hypothetical protein
MKRGIVTEKQIGVGRVGFSNNIKQQRILGRGGYYFCDFNNIVSTEQIEELVITYLECLSGIILHMRIRFVCLFVLSRTSNFSAIWRLSPLPATGLQI